jgi:hypothetical protein
LNVIDLVVAFLLQSFVISLREGGYVARGLPTGVKAGANHKRVLRLMREDNLLSLRRTRLRRRRTHVTTGASFPILSAVWCSPTSISSG